jgi:hypothetical protein
MPASSGVGWPFLGNTGYAISFGFNRKERAVVIKGAQLGTNQPMSSEPRTRPIVEDNKPEALPVHGAVGFPVCFKRATGTALNMKMWYER